MLLDTFIINKAAWAARAMVRPPVHVGTIYPEVVSLRAEVEIFKKTEIVAMTNEATVIPVGPAMYLDLSCKHGVRPLLIHRARENEEPVNARNSTLHHLISKAIVEGGPMFVRTEDDSVLTGGVNEQNRGTGS